MRTIDKIIVHCSASIFGDAVDINRWHKTDPDKLFSQIGYHYVILNGYRDKDKPYNPEDDGIVETGRPVRIKGAHCKGYNTTSIGICLIGDRLFSGEQLYESLPRLLLRLMGKYSVKNVYGHNQFNPSKTCPNLDMVQIRELLAFKKVDKQNNV